ncbi:hypothetical protein [Tsukamurella sp. 1534]|uniref:hypothetical protein n=1 Tax=Tsukamurella sp. 1534 TaxID=1151061 RepID=UPI0002EFD0D2|nr:hypothetical protein [Tsukamurella sp. 1534]
MYLERFVADGFLDADGAERLRWESARYVSRIYLIVGERRVMAQNLQLCWEALDVGPGTPIALEVTSGKRGLLDDEQRAIAGFADTFRELLVPPAPRRHPRWRRRRTPSAT